LIVCHFTLFTTGIGDSTAATIQFWLSSIIQVITLVCSKQERPYHQKLVLDAEVQQNQLSVYGIRKLVKKSYQFLGLC